MNQTEIIEMARKSDFEIHQDNLITFDGIDCTSELIAFAKLVKNHYSYTHAHLWLTRIEGAVKAEREECAKLCDLAMLQNQEAINELEEDEHIAQCFIQGAMTQLVKTSKAIRERG